MTEPREPTDQLGIGATDMTDRTHPDSGCTTGGIVEMLQDRIAELESQLSSSGFTAADMATAEARGFRDGVASAAASAGSEPVAHLWQHSETGRTRIVMPDMIVDDDASWQVVGPLCLGAAPPTAQAEGWMPIETAPKDGTAIDLWRVGGGREPCAVWGLPPHCCGEMGRLCDSDWHDYQQGWVTDWFDEPEPDSEFTHWTLLPPPPTTPAGSGKGE